MCLKIGTEYSEKSGQKMFTSVAKFIFTTVAPELTEFKLAYRILLGSSRIPCAIALVFALRLTRRRVYPQYLYRPGVRPS